MRTIHRTVVSALIFSKDAKLLMGMKDPSAGGVYADCWHIPGGGVDEDETQEVALRRELLEEVGIDTNDCKVTLTDNQGTGETEKTLKDTGEQVLCKMQFNVYRVDIDKDAVDIETKTSDDLVKLEWVNLKRLNEYKLTPPSATLFKRLGYIQRRTPPQIIQEVGFDFSWDESKVWQLDLPTEDMPIEELTWHFDTPFLWSKPNGFYDINPRWILEQPNTYPEEYERTMQADTTYPIDIMFWRGKWLILDGLHRLMKQSLEDKRTVKVRKVPEAAIPKIKKSA
ncbi:MAG TPA: NUDIX hydrolase [Candidatus Saccharimonadales bacterium]|nr:NUDIX hydrolase [Candidatus Saccharimonadales bacterium]